jgi:hypothetical protein
MPYVFFKDSIDNSRGKRRIKSFMKAIKRSKATTGPDRKTSTRARYHKTRTELNHIGRPQVELTTVQCRCQCPDYILVNVAVWGPQVELTTVQYRYHCP